MSAGHVLCPLNHFLLQLETQAGLSARFYLWVSGQWLDCGFLYRRTSLSLLCHNTTSPPCLHVKAWWPKGSKAWDGQKEQTGISVTAMPNHHFTAIQNSAGSSWRLSLRKGITESQAAACGKEIESRRPLSGQETLSSNTLKS